jgi:hypothetical protein
MRKIVLKSEELAVESFETLAEPGSPGTVEGREIHTGPGGYTCQEMTCNPPSCPAFSCITQCAKGCPASVIPCSDIILLDGSCV